MGKWTADNLQRYMAHSGLSTQVSVTGTLSLSLSLSLSLKTISDIVEHSQSDYNIIIITYS